MCVRTILVYGLLMFSRKPRLIYAFADTGAKHSAQAKPKGLLHLFMLI